MHQLHPCRIHRGRNSPSATTVVSTDSCFRTSHTTTVELQSEQFYCSLMTNITSDGREETERMRERKRARISRRYNAQIGSRARLQTKFFECPLSRLMRTQHHKQLLGPDFSQFSTGSLFYFRILWILFEHDRGIVQRMN